MTQLTFAVGVLKIVNDFRTNKRDFSAFDVTKEFRAKVNAGEWELTDFPRELVDGSPTFRIDHEQVRGFIISLYNNNLLTDYEKSYGTYQGISFTMYKFKTATGVLGAVSANSSSGMTISFRSTPNAPQQSNVQGNLPNMIINYVSRKKAKGEVATLKGIQSRFKNLRLKVSDIRSTITSSTNLSVTPKPGRWPSLAVVA
jgi:hypothetical protein